MKFAGGRGDDEFEINVIPLIDVMLTLLMFFVMTATFERRSLMRVQLPEAASEVTAVDQQTLTVVIDADGRTYVGPNEVTNPGLESIKSALLAALERFKGRRLYRHNPTVTLMRTTADECRAIGEFLVANHA